MYLIGDIGNTEIKIFLFKSNLKLIKRIRIPTVFLNNNILYSKLKFLKKYKNKINKVVFSSVVPSVFKMIKFILLKIIKKNCIELKKCKFNNLIKVKVNKKQIGSDRLSNAISVIDNKNNYIIVDFGTATTFDVVIKNQYLGGIISPGVNLSLRTLISKASMIPNIKLKTVKKILGKNTLHAVRSGFYWGYSGLITNVINKIFKQTKKKYKIIFTGGFAHFFKNSMPFTVTIDRNLTINGLLKIVHLII